MQKIKLVTLVIVCSIFIFSCNIAKEQPQTSPTSLTPNDTTSDLSSIKNRDSIAVDTSNNEVVLKENRMDSTKKDANLIDSKSSNIKGEKVFVKDNDQLTIVQLGNIEGERATDLTHILGYKIINSKLLSAENSMILTKSISNPINRISDMKKCMFIPNYAIMKHNKAIALIATDFCPKMMLIDASQKQSFVELKEESELATLINKLYK